MSLIVRVVDSDDRPVSGTKVTIFINHDIHPPTNLTGYTDSHGLADFEFESGISADVYVGGELQIEGAELDTEVTVTT